MPSELPSAPTQAAPRCVEHHGQHARYLGHCVAVGAQVPRPLLFSRNAWDCECGVRVYAAVERSTMRRFTLDEASGDPHRCQPSVRVRLDGADLASALANAFEEVRRRREPKPVRQAPPDQPPPPAEQPPPERQYEPPSGPEREIRPVSVWSDNGSA